MCNAFYIEQNRQTKCSNDNLFYNTKVLDIIDIVGIFNQYQFVY